MTAYDGNQELLFHGPQSAKCNTLRERKIMRSRITTRQMALLFLGMFFLLQNIVFVSWAGEIIIIGNRDVPVSSLDISEIRSIFLGEKVKWDNNRKITFVILKTEAHEDFLSKYIRSTAAQYRNYWRRMVFTGKSRSPRSFKSPGRLLDYIANTSGSVSYIPSKAYRDKVKIILVNKEAEK